eukprot:gene47171-31804_t
MGSFFHIAGAVFTLIVWALTVARVRKDLCGGGVQWDLVKDRIEIGTTAWLYVTAMVLELWAAY